MCYPHVARSLSAVTRAETFFYYGLNVHAGWEACISHPEQQQRMASRVERELQDHPDTLLVFTGHSLGGDNLNSKALKCSTCFRHKVSQGVTT